MSQTKTQNWPSKSLLLTNGVLKIRIEVNNLALQDRLE